MIISIRLFVSICTGCMWLFYILQLFYQNNLIEDVLPHKCGNALMASIEAPIQHSPLLSTMVMCASIGWR